MLSLRKGLRGGETYRVGKLRHGTLGKPTCLPAYPPSQIGFCVCVLCISVAEFQQLRKGGKY